MSDKQDRSSVARHAWIEDAKAYCAAMVTEAGGEFSDPIRVSIGFPLGARGSGKSLLGQAWHIEASADGFREIFISPVLATGADIIPVLLHEMIHAALPGGEGHGKRFGAICKATGLLPPLPATTASEALLEAISGWVEVRGEYPAGLLTSTEDDEGGEEPGKPGPGRGEPGRAQPKQGTRMLKVMCDECGYIARVSRQWLEVGAPICPTHRTTMRHVPSEGDENKA